MRERISVCITAGNEEQNIRRCLESVKWADEIIVIDSFSTDRTVEIAREFTNLVFKHKWLGYIGQKNLIKDLALHPWILFIDADEEMSCELREEILNEFEMRASLNVAGYEFPRMVRYLGRWIKHGDWYPDFKMRLFRKDKAQCGGTEPHDKTTVDGIIKRLKSPLYHYTYNDITDQVSTINHYSSIGADELTKENRKSLLLDITFRPLWGFFRSYVLKRGFMDGFPGFIIAINIAYGIFLKYAKLWEQESVKQQ